MTLFKILIIFFLILFSVILFSYRKKIQARQIKTQRLKQYKELVNQWTENDNYKKNIANYLNKKNINTIAIYGLGDLGLRLYKNFKRANIKIDYIIDKSADDILCEIEGIPVINLDEINNQNTVDVVIVTPFHDFENIQKDLMNSFIKKESILSLGDIISEI